jgi:hypothetical protein
MNTPVILVPTYARIRWLEEQLACLLAQDTACKVLVVNDCPWQTLSFTGALNDRVLVQCVNVPPFPNMGAKRNAMLRMSGARLAMWSDDDDLCLPWMVHRFMSRVRHQGAGDWALSWKDYTLHGDTWGMARWPLSCIGPADQWLARGGADETDLGEDKILRLNLGRDTVMVDCPAYVYRWGQGTHHLSGRGEPVAFPSYREEAEKRREAGTEPEGVIKLIPRLRARYWENSPFAVREKLQDYLPSIWAYDLT